MLSLIKIKDLKQIPVAAKINIANILLSNDVLFNFYLQDEDLTLKHPFPKSP